MRLVAITRILDEADLVEAFARHTSSFVDHHIFLDNGSADGTLEILLKLKSEGLSVTILQNKSVSFNEVHFNTYMYFEAVSVFGADWVLCLDCDEFINAKDVGGGLRSALEQSYSDNLSTGVIKIPLADYHCTEADGKEMIVPIRMKYRSNVTENTKVFISKKYYGPETTVAAGNHQVYVRGDLLDAGTIQGLYLAHYPARSGYQIIAKCLKGWAKVLASEEAVLKSGTSYHYRGIFESAKNNPKSVLGHLQNGSIAVSTQSLNLDPLIYMGGELKYTEQTDDVWRCMKSMIGYLEDLATRHGRLLTECNDARSLSSKLNTDIVEIK